MTRTKTTTNPADPWPAAADFETGSFRDPDARVFRHGGQIYRALSERGAADWEALAATRFYRRFSGDGRLVRTEAVQLRELPPGAWATVLQHETLPFVSYPYEWCFGMLKDAAAEQLHLTRAALDEGMTLKDATPYNSQWRGHRPVFIDLGSFTRRRAGEPWAGYRQFCQLFLYPLMLQAYKDLDFQPLLRGSLEGLTPSEFVKLMSWRERLRPGVLTHGVLHARLERRFDHADTQVRGDLKQAGFNEEMIKHNVARLLKLVGKLAWRRENSEWAGYAQHNSYDEAAREAKHRFVRETAERVKPGLAWDLGANTGEYARLIAPQADYVVAMDADPLAVERLYRDLKGGEHGNILPLVVDLADPPPALGWNNAERQTLAQRGRPDLILALALIHHLAIGRNIPPAEIVAWLARQTSHLVIEWVGKGDPMVKRLLRNRDDVFGDYERAAFEGYLRAHFRIDHQQDLPAGERCLYFCTRRDAA